MPPGSLNNLWFVLIALLWIGYFFLEGFDFGVGILLPFLARTDGDRRILIHTIGPVWDANEVWLIVAGGATFAAFPNWYATLFSGFYLALLLILLALICRAVAFEFRDGERTRRWRQWWDRAIFFGSVVPALLWGMAFSDMLHGVPIGASGDYVGTILDLIQPYAVLGGVTLLVLVILHGAAFLALKTEDDVSERARRAALRLWPFAAAAVFAFLAWSHIDSLRREDQGVVPGIVPIAALGAVLTVRWLLRERRKGWAFAATGATIALVTASFFMALYPRVMVSSLGTRFDLTVYNAASGPYSLGVMTIVAAILLPLVLLYQGWTYWVFRQRVGRKDLAGGY